MYHIAAISLIKAENQTVQNWIGEEDFIQLYGNKQNKHRTQAITGRKQKAMCI